MPLRICYRVARALDTWHDEYLTPLHDWFSKEIDDAVEFEDCQDAMKHARMWEGWVEMYERVETCHCTCPDTG